VVESPGRSYGVQPDGFRLPEETHVGRVRLQVADLSRSLEYYEGTLGFRTLVRSSDRAELGPADDDRVLVELDERPGARPAPRRGTIGLFHFAILLPDRAALGRFLRHALGQGAVSGIADHAVSEAIYLTDPDGLGIEVYADRPRAEWRAHADRQLHITTEPLNVDDVIAAGGDQPWTHVMAGTTMGHVHLHVGDLDRAAAFYHRGVGFDKTMWTYPGALFFSAGGYHHHLGTNTWSSGARAPDDQARLLSWDLETSDPDAVERSLAKAGYAASRLGDGWSVADPWGTVIEIRPLRI
jgi:catechol 2,3-dioxygenase